MTCAYCPEPDTTTLERKGVDVRVCALHSSAALGISDEQYKKALRDHGIADPSRIVKR